MDIEIEAVDRQGLLHDISTILLREKINVTATRTHSHHHAAIMRFTLLITECGAIEPAPGIDTEPARRELGFPEVTAAWPREVGAIIGLSISPSPNHLKLHIPCGSIRVCRLYKPLLTTTFSVVATPRIHLHYQLISSPVLPGFAARHHRFNSLSYN